VSVSRRLVDETGNLIVLGSRLGSGGEGSVFDMPETAGDLVAKIYHEALPVHKQAKLHAMASLGNSYLRTISAWPLRTVRELPSGQVAGFLMPKIAECEPIHHLYSPAQRKQFFPKADYAFLISAARNVAAAFDSIHAHGHVVGDVNQGNLVVRADSIVRFIDCDSFQITVGRTRFPCEVGVQHFTPPELQNCKSFHSVARTPNHDTFGLAILVFHLLFMGRHPYAGIYLGQGDMPIEKAIAEYRFAYGEHSHSRDMETPPNALPMSLVSPAIAQLFERAFTEIGIQTGRPSAGEWVAALDVFRRQLRTCSADHAHKFPAHLTGCPWCEIEARSGMQFFLPRLSVGLVHPDASATTEEVWQQIRAIKPPPAMPEYAERAWALKPTPWPRPLRVKTLGFRAGLAAAALTLGGAGWAWAGSWPLWALCLLALAALAGLGIARDPSRPLRAERAGALLRALKQYDDMLERYRQLADSRAFTDKFRQLVQVKANLDGLQRNHQMARLKLRESVRDAQLKKYLSGFLIANAKIGLIGPGRKATLASFGIETAADVTPSMLGRVRGFGEAQKADLLAWRAELETRFLFNPTRGVDPHDDQALATQFAMQKGKFDTTLREGLSELQKIRFDMLRMRGATETLLDGASRDRAQACADYAGVTGRWGLLRLLRLLRRRAEADRRPGPP
jgi:DNA-binding helix-hairpin-helix protein with protein kinase domain